MSIDPQREAVIRALTDQLVVLSAIAHDAQAAVAHPAVAPADWSGPASDAYAALEDRLRSRIAIADQAVSRAARSTRLALGDLNG